ncbi:site-specific integrase [Beijerinckia sp. L45]|uniref:site-specific integrase n=1 Tax=Beijerinckia sp. L45 TaxID=1641855 RepID=UPI00131D34AD|nr:site-specific integrase [Beijerinckia sp. L45]
MHLPAAPVAADLPSTQLIEASASAESYARAEKSAATRKAYEADLRDFSAWCSSVGAGFVPASHDTVAAYLAALADAGKSTSTVMRRVAAIAYAHRRLNLVDPTQTERVKQVVRGIKRTIGTAPKQKAPATAKFLRAMVKAIPDTMLGKRDRALLMIGFAGAFRRSELVALDVADIERQPEGILVHIRKSKTDQEGAGQIVAIPRGVKLRPVSALDDWLSAAGITSGPIFRSVNKGGRVQAARLTDKSVADVVKHRAAAAKLDPSLFAGHSLRAGFVTSALEDGADTLAVMSQTRHRSVETLRKYDRRAKAFNNHAGKGFL